VLGQSAAPVSIMIVTKRMDPSLEDGNTGRSRSRAV